MGSIQPLNATPNIVKSGQFRLIPLALTLFLLPSYWLVMTLPDSSQGALSAMLAIFSIVLAFAWCVPFERQPGNTKLDWFHPKLLFLGFYFLYFALPAIWICWGRDYELMWTGYFETPAKTVNSMLIIGMASIVAFGIGYKVPLSYPKKAAIRSFLDRRTVIQRKTMFIVIGIFGLFGACAKLYQLSLLGPLDSGILAYLSPSARREAGVQISQVTVIVASMLPWAALLYYFYHVICIAQDRNAGRTWSAVGFLLVAGTISYLLSGKRSDVLPLVLLPVIWHHYILHRLTVFQVCIYLPLALISIVGLLFARIALPLVTQGINVFDHIGVSVSDQLRYYANTAEFATFEMATAAVVHREDLLQELGGPIIGFLKYTFNTLIVFVPRGIWPDKPLYEDIGHVFFRYTTGFSENVGYSVTVWGSSLVFFHLPGLVVGMCLLGWIFRQVYLTVRPWEGKPLNVFVYAVFFWMAFQFMRFGTLGFTVLYFIIAMSVGVLGVFFVLRPFRAVDGHGGSADGASGFRS